MRCWASGWRSRSRDRAGFSSLRFLAVADAGCMPRCHAGCRAGSWPWTIRGTSRRGWRGSTCWADASAVGLRRVPAAVDLLFVRDRPLLAAATASLAGVLHSTYLLGGGVLVLAYLFVLTREGRWRTGLLSACWPWDWWCRARLHRTPPSRPPRPRPPSRRGPSWCIFASRITRRSRPGSIRCRPANPWMWRGCCWFDGLACSPIMLISFAAAVGADADAMVARQRLAGVAVSLADLHLPGAAGDGRPGRQAGGSGCVAWSETAAWLGAGVVLAACVVRWHRHHGARARLPPRPGGGRSLYDARAQRGGGRRLPGAVQAAEPAGAQGLALLDFVLEDDRTGKRNPLEMQRFRLATAAPILVDFKAIPYRDVDVLEWRRRIAVGLSSTRTWRRAGRRWPAKAVRTWWRRVARRWSRRRAASDLPGPALGDLSLLAGKPDREVQLGKKPWIFPGFLSASVLNPPEFCYFQPRTDRQGCDGKAGNRPGASGAAVARRSSLAAGMCRLTSQQHRRLRLHGKAASKP